jgi:ABC-type branched-subunit amino acid transport system substrate-binding protein
MSTHGDLTAAKRWEAPGASTRLRGWRLLAPLFALLTSCAPAPVEYGPAVGVILDYTGPEPNGFGEEQALLLAARFMDDARGNDHPFRFVYRDSRDNPEDARRATRELVAEGVDVVIGPATDRLVPVVAEELDEAGILLVSANPTIGDLGMEGAPWFRMSPGNLTGSTTPELIGEHVAAEFVARGARRALILSDEDVYNVELARGFKSALAARGGEVVEELAARTAPADRLLAAARQTDAEAVLLAISIAAAAELLTDVHTTTRDRPEWLLTPRLKSELLTVNTPSGALDGAFGVSLRIPNHAPGFVASMQEVSGREPFENTYFMYDASAVVLIALDQVGRRNHGTIERAELSEAIFEIGRRGGVQVGWNDFPAAVAAARDGRGVQYNGLTGTIVLTPSGVRVGGDTVVFEVENHEFVDRDR